MPRRLFVTDIWNKDFNTEGLSEQDQDQVAESTAETVGGWRIQGLSILPKLKGLMQIMKSEVQELKMPSSAAEN